MPSFDYLLRTTYDAIKVIIAGVEGVGNNAPLVKEFIKTYQGSGALGRIEFDEARNKPCANEF